MKPIEFTDPAGRRWLLVLSPAGEPQPPRGPDAAVLSAAGLHPGELLSMLRRLLSLYVQARPGTPVSLCRCSTCVEVQGLGDHLARGERALRKES